MPETAEKIVKELNTSIRPMEDLDKFGLYKSGAKLAEKPEMLFARLDVDEVHKKAEKIAEEQLKALKKAEKSEEKQAKKEETPSITIDDFAKVQLKVGKVLECKKVEGADKLLQSRIQIGDEVRTILSGIAKWLSLIHI